MVIQPEKENIFLRFGEAFRWNSLHFQYSTLLTPKELSENEANIISIFSIDVETEAERSSLSHFHTIDDTVWRRREHFQQSGGEELR